MLTIRTIIYKKIKKGEVGDRGGKKPEKEGG